MSPNKRTRDRRYCDGLTRRDFVQIGALGAFGLTLADFLAMEAQAAATAKSAGQPSPPARSAIFLWQSGGPSHLDTWDPKPEAPAEIRGEFGTVETNLPGVRISDQLPRLAKQMDKLCVVRSVTHNLASHAPGSLFMQTGNRPLSSLRYPTYGSVVARERPAERGLPTFVTVPHGGFDTADAGYLGVAYNTFGISGDPNDKKFSVRSLSMPSGMSLKRLADRRSLAEDLDQTFRNLDRKLEIIDGVDQFYAQAYDIIRSPKTRAAFDLSREPASVRDAYGRNRVGQSCLLARRMTEAGVRFVQVISTGWDTHSKNFERLKTRLLPEFDQGYAALLSDLADRGLLESTALMSTGEFGRTPKINKTAGRDHWSRGMSVTLAGAGVRGGQIIGSTTPGGETPASEPHTPEDVGATFLGLIGVDHKKEYLTGSGRPVMIVHDGTPIEKAIR